MSIATQHLYNFLRPETLLFKLSLAADILRTYDFDTLAFRGMSGAFVGPSLAVTLNKQMILVRKPGDDSHSSLETEGYKEAKRYIIVDDFTSSGRTRKAIVDAVSVFAPEAVCLGLLPVNDLMEDDRNRAFSLL